MANPFAIAAALSRTTTIGCPHCGMKKVVEIKPAHHRVGTRCKKHFADPLAGKVRKKK